MEHTDLDRSFMEMASVASESSLCKRRQVGVIIRPNAGIKIFGGFNDTILYGKKHCIRYEYKEGERLDLCPAIHAEVMAIAIAARGGGSIEGATMYTTSCIPCKMCMQAIVLAGIKRIVVAEDKDYAGDTSARRLAEIYDIQIDVLDVKEGSDG
jgi:deoxycytidylate deaminase